MATWLDWLGFYLFLWLVAIVVIGVLTIGFIGLSEELRSFLRKWLGVK
jgi:hypothetical protein